MDTDHESAVLWIGKDVGFGGEEGLEDRSSLEESTVSFINSGTITVSAR